MRVLLKARARLSASVPECDCGWVRVVLSARVGLSVQFYSTFCKTHGFPYGKKKLSAQGSQATLSDANVSHVKAKQED